MADGSSTHDRLWGGRFTTAPEEATVRFMAGRDVEGSPPADANLIADDLWATSAHVTMLARQSIIPAADARVILDGLAEIGRRHEAGLFTLDPAREDAHTNIELTLAELCGPEVGGRVHTGRSRNDQVATAMRLYLRRQALRFAGDAIALAHALLDVAVEHTDTVMPGFTHHQPATPTTLGHVLASYAEAFSRDAARLLGWLDLHNWSPLGGAAGYGTTVPLDRALTAAYLAFDGPHLSSLDPLTTRGEPETDLALALATHLKHLSSLAQTVILLGAPGYDLLRLSPAYSSGSSIMPQKVNPCTMEAIKARAAVAGGVVSGLLGVGAAAFMGYNRDTQWSKYLIMDLVGEACDAAAIMAGAWRTMTINREGALELAGGYFVGSTALMEWLVAAHGLPLRQAKRVVETAVRLSDEAGATEVIGTALRRALQERDIGLSVDDARVAAVQEPRAIVAASTAIGGPASATVTTAIAALRARLDGDADRLARAYDDITAARARLAGDDDALTSHPF